MAVPVIVRPTFDFGTPESLFDLQTINAVADPNLLSVPYDVFPDGQKFVMVQRIQDEDSQAIVVVQNWFSEFEDSQ